MKENLLEYIQEILRFSGRNDCYNNHPCEKQYSL